MNSTHNPIVGLVETRAPARRIVTVMLALLSIGLPAFAQDRGFAPVTLPNNSPFLGGVPTGAATPGTMRLSVLDAIERALEHNLGVLNAEESVDRTRGTRWLAMSRLLPHVNASVSEVRQVISLEAFGLPLADLPPTVGPFNVFDARLFVTQALFDRRALSDTRAESHMLAASRHSLRSARDLVVLVAANLYLQTLAEAARAEAARAQMATSRALFAQAQDLKQGGIIAGIDVVRAEVRLGTERQRATAAENNFQKSKLALARVIGLPLGQEFTLNDRIPEVPVPEMTTEGALAQAYAGRADYLAAQERLKAAEARRQAALAEALPSAHLNADYGALGLTPGTARSTFSVRGTVSVPIFQGGRLQGRLLETDAELRSRRAEIEDLRAQIYYDVRTSFLDLRATGEELQVATRNRELAAQQLTQSRDRFAAGVASNVEVVQAQEAVALGSEQYISAVYAYNVSKALLARSLGSAEEAVRKYLGGVN